MDGGAGVIAAIGDLVEDIVVRLRGPLQFASDTNSSVLRRRGGSAANVSAAVARAGHASRFIGQIGDDPHGELLAAALRRDGVDVVGHRGGRTGTIVVLVDHHGERTMLTDRGASTTLDRPDEAWLDGVSTVHVPVYSLVGEPLARTTTTLIEWAHRRGMRVSVDASSSSVIDSVGADRVLERLRTLRPDVVFCNEDEAAALWPAILPTSIGNGITVVKRGAKPAIVHESGGGATEVPAVTIAGDLDTTGAGDAFAAGFLVALEHNSSARGATEAGHRSAAHAIRLVSSHLHADGSLREYMLSRPVTPT